MKKICFYFQVHQPFRLKNYPFFEIGQHNNYFDEATNKEVMIKVATKCYLPMNKLLLDLIAKHGDKFQIAFSISGTAFKQFEMYAPEVLDSFVALSKTNSVEFLAETYSHSLVSIINEEEFVSQVEEQIKYVQKYFNRRPEIFRNTELIYSNKISDMVSRMGFKAILSEGADHILSWRSPNNIYRSSTSPELKILLKNYTLSDDIAFRFSDRNWEEWPLTVDKFSSWINSKDDDENINLFMDYETFGEHQWKETGIFDFMKSFIDGTIQNTNNIFVSPSQAIETSKIQYDLDVHFPISWADQERDLTAWLGNNLQDDAFDKLYNLYDNVKKTTNPQIKEIWKHLQTSDHFYYMCTKWFSDGNVHKYFNPYESPYVAYINYMNIINDFKILVDKNAEIEIEEYESHIYEQEQLIPCIEAPINKHEMELSFK